MLVISNLSKKFSDSTIFEKINFTATPGTVTVIEGPNGSGKTTFLKCIAGLLDYQSGYIEYNFEKIHYQNSYCRNFIGFSPNQERTFFPQLTLLQNLIFFSRLFKTNINNSVIDNYLSLFELSPWKNKSYQSCSSGIKKRVSIIRSLLHRPEILLLDEPFSHIDKNFTIKMKKILINLTEQQNLITLITTNQEIIFKSTRFFIKGSHFAEL